MSHPDTVLSRVRTIFGHYLSAQNTSSSPKRRKAKGLKRQEAPEMRGREREREKHQLSSRTAVN